MVSWVLVDENSSILKKVEKLAGEWRKLYQE
jgi:hypothetical protein